MKEHKITLDNGNKPLDEYIAEYFGCLETPADELPDTEPTFEVIVEDKGE
ncbi:MAG: hypothetical protein ACI4MV_01295 [Christensenellales bacterium]